MDEDSVGVLLVGFNRPELIQKRFEEMSRITLSKNALYVSVDGPRKDNNSDVNKQKDLTRIFEHLGKNFVLRDVNLGCDKHIPIAIGEILRYHKFVIVVEDDISFSQNAIEEFIRLANRHMFEKEPFVAVSMSGMPTLLPRSRNAWRPTTYFSAWGYMLNRTFWTLHEETLSAIRDVQAAKALFLESKTWNYWNNRKKYIWLERFERGNYDYQIQRTMCLYDLKALAPITRVADNEGHSLLDATHTKFRAPWYLRPLVAEKYLNQGMNIIDSFVLVNLMEWLDSQTWAGDGLLSKRGRVAGFRTILRRKTREFFSDLW